MLTNNEGISTSRSGAALISATLLDSYTETDGSRTMILGYPDGTMRKFTGCRITHMALTSGREEDDHPRWQWGHLAGEAQKKDG
jgi:hypothetical protein